MTMPFRSVNSAAGIRFAPLLLAALATWWLAAAARGDDKAAAKPPSAKSPLTAVTPAKPVPAKPAPAAPGPAKLAPTIPEHAKFSGAKPKPVAKPVVIPVADLKHPAPVDFQTEVLPVLRRNCIACHNGAKAENHLVLETPQSILKGGESGPAIVPKHGGDSLLLRAAAHLDDPTMPPPDNNVKAVSLTPDELGLIKLWIDQGATGRVVATVAPVHWQRLAPTVKPILAVAVSPDGELAACGRDNEIFIYGIASGAMVARLVDPTLAGQSGSGAVGIAHLDLVQSLAFQPSGDLLASGGFREVKLWRRPRNVRLGALAGSSGPVRAVAVSPDGKRAATGEPSGMIRLWALPTCKPLPALIGHAGAVTGLAFSPDGNTLFSSSSDKSLRAWKAADGSVVGKIDTPAAIDAMILAHGGTQICTGEADNIIRVWAVAGLMQQQSAKPQAASGGSGQGKPPKDAIFASKPLKELKGHSGPVTALATWGDGMQILSGGADGTVRGWNLDSGRQTRQISHGAAVIAVAMRGDGKRFASCGSDNIVRLWNGENDQKIAELHGDFRQQREVGRLQRAADVARSRVGEATQRFVEAAADAKQESDGVKTADVRKATALAELALQTVAAAKGLFVDQFAAAKAVVSATVDAKRAADKAAAAKKVADKDPKNKDLAKLAESTMRAAVAAQQRLTQAKQRADETARNGAQSAAKRKRAEDALAAAVHGVERAETAAHKAADAVPVAKKAAEAAKAAEKVASGAVQAATKAAAGGKPIRALAFSPNGFFLALAGDNRLVQTVSADNAAPADTFEGAGDAVLSLAYTPAGGLLAGGADKSAIVWNTRPDWLLLRTIGSADEPSTFADRVIALDFSPDGRLLATGGGQPSRSGELKLWNPADGSLVRTMPDAHSDTICSVRFSPDGTLLASGAADRTMKVFNVANGSLMKSFEGHTHHVLGVAWRADGQQIATAGADNSVKVWDFASGEQRRTIEAFSKEVTAITFVGTTPRAMTSAGDHYLRLFNTDNGVQDKIYFGANDFLDALGVTPDGTLVAAGGQDGVLRVWNVDSTLMVRSLDPAK
jgi:WD40 repeat protein